MPTPTYNLIQEITVSGSVTTTISFTSIPATFDDLVVVGRAKLALSENITFRFNGDATTNYNYVVSNGSNGAAASAVITGASQFGFIDGTTTQNFHFQVHVTGYQNTNWRKTIFSSSFTELGVQNNAIRYTGGQWNSVATISSISFSTSAGTNYVAGSVFQLYGIKGSN